MKKWRGRLLFAMAVALALAGDAALSYKLGSERVYAAGAPAIAPQPQDPVDQFRLEREQLRARQQAQFNDIIYAAHSDEATVAAAQRQLLAMMERSEREATLEGVLRARGFEGALVTVADSSANVLVRREALTQRETAVILELVMRETGLTGGNVKIIPVK